MEVVFGGVHLLHVEMQSYLLALRGYPGDKYRQVHDTNTRQSPCDFLSIYT
jgi:hypothetical protein